MRVCSGGYTEPNVGPLNVPLLLPINNTHFMWEEFLHGGKLQKKAWEFGKGSSSMEKLLIRLLPARPLKTSFFLCPELDKIPGNNKHRPHLEGKKNTRMHSTAFLLGFFMFR